jgi:hypothetical protein
MINLRADNRTLVNNAKFAYLTGNNQSNAATLDVSNVEPFEVGTPILLSEIGQTDAEILKVNAISSETITLGDVDNIATSTTYSHPESTRMIALQYDQIRFFWTAALGTIADENPVFSDSTPLTAWTSLDPTSFYSTYADTAHSTGFGWFQYKNALTGETSLESNPIPYAGFTLNTAQQVFADFDSMLNTNELKLVSTADKFNWLNEALAVLKNKLNLTNVEYTVSSMQTITSVASTAEYELPADFADIVEFVDEDNVTVDFIPVSQVMSYNGTNPTTTYYYLRGRYIGLSPTPTTATAGDLYYYRYRAKATRVTNLSTYIDLPDNAFFTLKDWMMYRAMLKFTNPMANTYYQSFNNAMNLYIQSAVKRSANLDSWDIASTANT